MKNNRRVLAMTAVALAIANAHPAVDTANVPWVPLFNGRDLTGWYQLLIRI